MLISISEQARCIVVDTQANPKEKKKEDSKSQSWRGQTREIRGN